MDAFIWIQELVHKKILNGSAAIRDQATVFHDHLMKKHEKNESFNASKSVSCLLLTKRIF